MEHLKAYLLPYSISNIVFLLCILGAAKKPYLTRLFFIIGFVAAGCVNTITAINTPDFYLFYGRTTFSPVYRSFIDHYFADHITEMVVLIAIGQFLIAIGLLFNDSWVRIASIGGIIFGLAIAPLGVGSAFPATIFMAIAFFMLIMRYKHDFIWKPNQYKHQQNVGKSLTFS